MNNICSFCKDGKKVVVSKDETTKICSDCATRCRILLQEHAEKRTIYDGLHKVIKKAGCDG